MDTEVDAGVCWIAGIEGEPIRRFWFARMTIGTGSSGGHRKTDPLGRTTKRR
jgi:hypothetical protein